MPKPNPKIAPKQIEAPRRRFSPALVAGLLVGLFAAVAFILRVWLPYDQVFTALGIKFTGTDAYYQMRIVDNLVRNFPNLYSFDPYLIFPGGMPVGNIHFFNWLIAGSAWLIGLGSPSQQLVDAVGAFAPAVLGSLIVIPAFFIGKTIHGRWAGVFAAGLIAILPGEFLGRSILGFTDQHVAEILFSAIAMMFLIMAVKTANVRQLTLQNVLKQERQPLIRPAVFSLLGGFFLGLYILTWAGSLMFAFILTLFFAAQFIIDHLRRRSTDYLSLVGVPFFAVALVMTLPVLPGTLYLVTLLIALLVPAILNILSRLMKRSNLAPAYFPVAVAGLGLAGAGILYLAMPAIFKAIVSSFGIFAPKGVYLTIMEMQPLLFSGGRFSLSLAWGNFTTGFFISLIAIGILVWLMIKRGAPEKTALLIWSLIMLAAAIGQRRFAYYLSFNVALLSGYLAALVLDWIVSRQEQPVTKRREQLARSGKGAGGFKITVGQVNISLGIVIIFLTVFLPNVQPAIDTGKRVLFAPPDAWLTSMAWMKDNTPDPFGNAGQYDKLETGQYTPLENLRLTYPGKDTEAYMSMVGAYKYPDSAYGVLAWWDYGYWITRMARRIPSANPSQEPWAVRNVASVLTAQNETATAPIMKELRASYVVIDSETAYIDPGSGGSKFWAVALWADKQPSDFYDVYYVTNQGVQMPVILFHPEYYRALSTRLYSFDGKAVEGKDGVVISFEEKQVGKAVIKVITSAKQFATYQEAQDYIAGQTSGNYKLVGTKPLVSPVPLEALEKYKLVHSSEQLLALSGNMTPAIKIFQYIP